MTVHFNTKKYYGKGCPAAAQWDNCCICDSKVKRKRNTDTDRRWTTKTKKGGQTKTQTEAQSEWRRVIKKRCCLAEEDITSDTDVKLASLGTIRPLCCSPGGVECVCVAVSRSFYTAELHHASPILLLPIPFSFWLSPPFSPSTLRCALPLLSTLLTLSHSLSCLVIFPCTTNWKCVAICVFFPASSVPKLSSLQSHILSNFFHFPSYFQHQNMFFH